MIKSQIAYNEGNLWQSAWEQQVALQVSGTLTDTIEGYRLVSLGIRCQSLGYCFLADEYLTQAETSSLSSDQFEVARINRIRSLRLSNRLTEAKNLCATTKELSNNSQKLVDELEWEEKCLLLHDSTDNLDHLVKLTRKDQSHYMASYIIEGFLWSAAASKKESMSNFPIIKNLTRRKGLDFQKDSFLFKFSCEVQNAYDSGIPFPTRFNTMQKMVAGIPKQYPIDKPLLCWLALARWLIRHNNQRLAQLAISEYEAVSLKASRGRCADVLGVAQDLVNKLG